MVIRTVDGYWSPNDWYEMSDEDYWQVESLVQEIAALIEVEYKMHKMQLTKDD